MLYTCSHGSQFRKTQMASTGGGQTNDFFGLVPVGPAERSAKDEVRWSGRADPSDIPIWFHGRVPNSPGERPFPVDMEDSGDPDPSGQKNAAEDVLVDGNDRTDFRYNFEMEKTPVISCEEVNDLVVESHYKEIDTSDESSVKRKRLSSAWDGFKEVYEGGIRLAVCNICSMKLKAASSNGTSSLRRHWKRCAEKKDTGKGKRQQKIQFPRVATPLRMMSEVLTIESSNPMHLEKVENLSKSTINRTGSAEKSFPGDLLFIKVPYLRSSKNGADCVPGELAGYGSRLEFNRMTYHFVLQALYLQGDRNLRHELLLSELRDALGISNADHSAELKHMMSGGFFSFS